MSRRVTGMNFRAVRCVPRQWSLKHGVDTDLVDYAGVRNETEHGADVETQ
jgi:hypothetical protein